MFWTVTFDDNFLESLQKKSYNKLLEKLSQVWLEVRVRHFCDIWHPADHALTLRTIVLTDAQAKAPKT